VQGNLIEEKIHRSLLVEREISKILSILLVAFVFPHANHFFRSVVVGPYEFLIISSQPHPIFRYDSEASFEINI
jgi:hypothetical protein